MGSGASTPRLNTAVSGASGATTPALPAIDRSLQGKKRTYGGSFENGDIGEKIQVRDLVHVLELDGKERRTLVTMLARMKNSDKDDMRRPSEDKRGSISAGPR